jgi:hypothetical protein
VSWWSRVTAKGEEPRSITPSDDPYEFDWPDDAKELRAAEREAVRKRAAIRPAPRYLTAYLIGTWTVLVLIGIFTVINGMPQVFVGVVAPIAVVALVAALPLGAIIEVLTRRFNQGISVLVFLLVGASVGYYWTFTLTGWMYSHYTISWWETAEVAARRDAVSLFMMTAVACAFVLARNLTDEMKVRPKVVYIALAVLVLFAVPSAIGALRDFATVGF